MSGTIAQITILECILVKRGRGFEHGKRSPSFATEPTNGKKKKETSKKNRLKRCPHFTMNLKKSHVGKAKRGHCSCGRKAAVLTKHEGATWGWHVDPGHWDIVLGLAGISPVGIMETQGSWWSPGAPTLQIASRATVFMETRPCFWNRSSARRRRSGRRRISRNGDDDNHAWGFNPRSEKRLVSCPDSEGLLPSRDIGYSILIPSLLALSWVNPDLHLRLSLAAMLAPSGFG